MAYLTTAKLKERSLDSATRYRAEYDSTDSDVAYSYAIARCGYENPASSADTDYVLKQYWLIETMKLWFYRDVLDRNLLKFDVGDLKAGQIRRGIKEQIDDMEAALAKAKESADSAHLFVSASEVFGEDMVVGSGIVDDMAGNDYRSA